jgi:hypothetical protein
MPAVATAAAIVTSKPAAKFWQWLMRGGQKLGRSPLFQAGVAGAKTGLSNQLAAGNANIASPAKPAYGGESYGTPTTGGADKKNLLLIGGALAAALLLMKK